MRHFFALTFRLWDALVYVDRRAPLYATLWRSHRRYVMWHSNEISGASILYLMLNIALAPLFVVLPLLIIYPFGAYWAGEVAGQIEQEQRQNRLDLLAVLPKGRLHTHHTLSVLSIRRTGIYARIEDGLGMTALFGGIVGFMLGVGVLVASVEAETLLANGVLQLVNMLGTTVGFFCTVYIQQIQSVLLAQLIGLVVPVVADFSVGARVAAIVSYISVQVALYIVAGVMWLGVFPAILRLPALNMAVGTVVTGGLLVTTYEWLLRGLWGRLQTDLNATLEASPL